MQRGSDRPPTAPIQSLRHFPSARAMSSNPASTSAASSPLALPLHGLPLRYAPARGSRRTGLRSHLWQPLSVFALLSWVLMGLGGDQWLADRLFALQGHAWTLQSSPFLQQALHA